jgi:hypothetical protein
VFLGTLLAACKWASAAAEITRRFRPAQAGLVVLPCGSQHRASAWGRSRYRGRLHAVFLYPTRRAKVDSPPAPCSSSPPAPLFKPAARPPR